MNENLNFPSIVAIKSVLRKVGIEFKTRSLNCQDAKYTTCRLEELDQYVELYSKIDTTVCEKRVLGCYFLQCLNQHFQNFDKADQVQDKAFKLLHFDIDIHENELEYWMNTEDPCEDHWWSITKEILHWRQLQS